MSWNQLYLCYQVGRGERLITLPAGGEGEKPLRFRFECFNVRSLRASPMRSARSMFFIANANTMRRMKKFVAFARLR